MHGRVTLDGEVAMLRLFAVENDCLWKYFGRSRASKSEAEYDGWGEVSRIGARVVVAGYVCEGVGGDIVNIKRVNCYQFSAQLELLLRRRCQTRA